MARTCVLLVLLTAVAGLVVRLARTAPDDTASLSADWAMAAPVALPAGSAYVRSAVLDDDHLRVTHWLHLRGAAFQLRLHLPRTRGLPLHALSAHHVVVVADGQRVYAPRSIAGGGATVYLSGAQHVAVRYVLVGAVQRTEPPAGRALARVVSLDVRDGDAVTHTETAVVGARVLSLACSSPQRGAVPQPCGAARASGWSVTLRGPQAGDRVMAQLDLDG